MLDTWLPWLTCVGLLSVRLTVALALSPAFASFGVPGPVRVVLTLALAFLLLAGHSLPPEAVAWAQDPLTLLSACGAEVLLGALFGLSVHIVFAAFAIAGRLLDVQIGFAIGSTFDPVTRTRADIVGALMSLLAVTLFFVSDSHMELVRFLDRSVDLFPLGQLPALDDPMRPLLAAGWMYAFAIALAAPVSVALLLVDIAVGVLSRNMPQMNVLVMATPIKVLVAFLVLSLSVRTWAPLVHRDFDRAALLLGVH